MVRIINIDTKTRTIRVSNADGDIKTWRTTESGTHFPIKEGQTTKEGLQEFLKKHVVVGRVPDAPAKKEPAKSGPDKNADVSDIITDYKKKMKALGPGASIRKTDRVEADAIKEFMTRKLGANRPYDDYYNYWLSGMDKATKDAFNEIYNESEAREMAFGELASDVDHSGMARGEPTYDELMQWSEKQKAKKAQQQPAKASSEQTKEIDAKIKDKKRELQNIIRSLTENVEDGYFDIAQEMMTDVEYVKGELQQLLDERAKLQQQPAKKEPKPAKRDIENIPVSQLTPAERKELWDKEQKHYKEKQKQVEQDLAGKNIKWSKEPDNKPALAGLKQKPAKKESVESISDEYMREINSLRKKAEKARKMGQGKTAMLLDTRADSLAKEMFEKEDSEKDARWAEHEAEMDRASKAREKAAKEQEEADFQAWKKQQKPAKKERNWWRGPREDEDAYFDRREKTFEEARKIDKVSDWYKKAFAGDTEIPKNQSITFDELAKGMLSGKIKDFYETVGVDSSDIREKIFEELSERTGRPYDDFYDAWLHGGKK